MNGRERFLSTIKGEISDCLPVDPVMDNIFLMQTAGEKGISYYKDPDKCVKAFNKVQELFQPDVIQLGTALAEFTELFGQAPEYPENDYVRSVGVIFHNLEEIKKAEIPDLKSIPAFKVKFEIARRLVGTLGKEFAIGARCSGTFNLAGTLVGVNKLFSSLITDLEFAHAILDLSCRILIELGKEFSRCGVDFVWYPDANSSPSCISPKYFKEIAVPYHTRFFCAMKEQGLYTVYHPCGGEYPIICEVLRIPGVDAFHFSELVDVGVARKICGPHQVLWSGVNPIDTLLLGSPDKVAKEVQDIIKKAGGRGHLVISPGCSLPAFTPHENLRAMINAVRSYRNSPVSSSI
jgi:uroporphyrinogen decarboxylase